MEVGSAGLSEMLQKEHAHRVTVEDMEGFAMESEKNWVHGLGIPMEKESSEEGGALNVQFYDPDFLIMFVYNQ